MRLIKTLRRFPQATVIVIGMLAVVSVYQNCSEVEFSPSKSESSVIDTDIPNDPPETPTEVVKASCTNRPIQRITVPVTFERTRETCPFGDTANGNLPRRNSYLQARIEQKVNFSLPEKTIICDMDFHFEPQRFTYDDQFIATFDDVILGASVTIPDFVPLEDEVYIYDWEAFKGKYWDHGTSTTFCHGADRFDESGQPMASCSWPVTEATAQIKVDMHSTLIQEIMAKNLGRAEHEFKFVSIGDDDNGDCEQSGITFEVTIDYVQE